MGGVLTKERLKLTVIEWLWVAVAWTALMGELTIDVLPEEGDSLLPHHPLPGEDQGDQWAH